MSADPHCSLCPSTDRLTWLRGRWYCTTCAAILSEAWSDAHAHRRSEEEQVLPVVLPDEPTEHPAGSEGKVEAMILRRQRLQTLFHPLDEVRLVEED